MCLIGLFAFIMEVNCQAVGVERKDGKRFQLTIKGVDELSVIGDDVTVPYYEN